MKRLVRHRNLHAFALLLLAAFAMQCKAEPSLNCEPACSAGMICDVQTGQCEMAPPLSLYNGELPGRAVQIVKEGNHLVLASIDSAQQMIVVGTISRNQRDFRVLQPLSRVDGKRLSMAASNERIALAWLDEHGQYLLATRAVGESNEQWQIFPVALEQTDGMFEYSGSENFTLALGPQGRFHLFFQNADRKSLSHLVATSHDEPWKLEEVDADEKPIPGVFCTAEQRQQFSRGVGLEPTALIGSQGLIYVAYYDGDCGDLRLAKYEDERWTVHAVDVGHVAHSTGLRSARGMTGRFPTMAFDANGRLALAYYDMTHGQLIYAIAHEGRFIYEVADEGYELDEFSQKRKQFVGAFANLQFDAQNTPKIVYMNTTQGHLQLATRVVDGNGRAHWVQRTLDSQAPAGFFANQVFSSAMGHVVVAERLEPRAQGIRSHLVLLQEVAP